MVGFYLYFRANGLPHKSMLTSLIDFIKRPKRFSPVISAIAFRSTSSTFTLYRFAFIRPVLNIRLDKFILVILFCLNNSMPVSAQISCCCDIPKEIIYPGLDFEFDQPPPFGYYSYFPGSFGPWTVTQGIIDHGDPAYCGGLANGNPNGPSAFIDLWGSPATGGGAAGTLSYTLTGLTTGNTYFIEFWYATFTAAGSFSANLKIDGGSLLNVNWTANNPGAAIWLKKVYSFVATGSTAQMSFTDTGPSSPTYQIGMLLDDIRIYECSHDDEKPVILNPPADEEVACTTNVPPVPTLKLSDNCDKNPFNRFKSRKDSISPCLVKYYRSWEIEDHCNNITTWDQLITIQDIDPPLELRAPSTKIIHCSDSVQSKFQSWIGNHCDAQMSDMCSSISWNISYSHPPKLSCDSVKVLITAQDACGNTTQDSSYFIVVDSIPLKITKAARSMSVQCSGHARDSLRSWLQRQGGAELQSGCSKAYWNNSFDGDSSRTKMTVYFVASDSCGHQDTTSADFTQSNHADTSYINNIQCQIGTSFTDTLIYTTQYCDSVVIRNNISGRKDTSYLKIDQCQASGPASDTLHLMNLEGCDSLSILLFEYHQPSRTLIKDFQCTYNQFSIDSIILAGQFCDSILVTERYPLRKDTTLINTTTCDSSLAGVMIRHLINTVGCDSLVILRQQFVSAKIEIVQSYDCLITQAYNDTVNVSGTGCDSLFITIHIPAKKDTTRLMKQTCKISEAGQKMEHFINAHGCDSLVVTDIVFQPSDSMVVLLTTCRRAEERTEKQSFVNRFGCDSMITRIYHFQLADTGNITQHTCNPSEVGTDSVWINNSGCDSLLLIHTLLSQSDTTKIRINTCIPSEAGIRSVMSKNHFGCDSLILTETTFQPVRLQYHLDSVSCHAKNDGILTITNLNDFQRPLILLLDQQRVDSFPVTGITSSMHDFRMIDSAGCESKILQFELYDPEELMIDLPDRISLQKGQDTLISFNRNRPVFRIEWYPQLCQGCDTIDFQGNDDLWLYCMVYDRNGCPARDSVYLQIVSHDEIYLPDAFSPNGDQVNDYYYPQGSANITVQEFRIFDRWGEVIFDTDHCVINESSTGWNGQMNHRMVNPGVYLLYLRYSQPDGTTKLLTRSFSLIR